MSASDIIVNGNQSGATNVPGEVGGDHAGKPNLTSSVLDETELGKTDLGRDRAAAAARCPQHRPGSILNPVAFDTLADASDELWIELQGQLYRLRKTKQGKLILTK